METNLNCDLGEKSIHHSGENDEQLMKVLIRQALHVVFMQGMKLQCINL